MRRLERGRRTVLVAEAVAPHWELLGRGRVEVARRETPEATVSETRVALLIDEILEVESERFNTIIVLVLQAKVQERIIEGAAH